MRSSNRVTNIRNLALISVGVFIVISTILFFTIGRRSSPIPVDIQSGATFPLYYPDALPEGYSIDNSSFSLSDAALIFSISYSDGKKKLHVSEQPKPITLNLDEFYAKRFISPETSFTAGNRIVVGSLASVKTASVVYDDVTWILIKAPNGIEQETLRQIAGSFRKSD